MDLKFKEFMIITSSFDVSFLQMSGNTYILIDSVTFYNYALQGYKTIFLGQKGSLTQINHITLYESDASTDAKFMF